MSQNSSTDLQIDLRDQTPLMKQYWELKSQASDSLLFFRMGDFYELFGQDAVDAASLLDITLTSRDKNKPNPLPMAGVPHHSAQGYIQRLLKAGKKVAICEQFEEISQKDSSRNASKIVRREIVRVLTPGVQFDSEGSEANYLATAKKAGPRHWVLACLDASTGEVLVSDPMASESLLQELRRLPIRHFLDLDEGIDLKVSLGHADILIENLPRNYLSQERAAECLKSHYDIQNLSTFVPSESGILALGVLVTYVLRTQQQTKLSHLRLPEPLHQPKSLHLGTNTAQHLDLDDLYSLMNRTKSTLGARELRKWLHSPLRSSDAISARQASVKELHSQWNKLGKSLSSCLSQIYDLERICGRVNTKLAQPRDTLALGQSLGYLRNLATLLAPVQTPQLIEIRNKFEYLSTQLGPLSDQIQKTQKEDAPFHAREGGIFKSGTSAELDRLLSLTEDGQKWLVELEIREREKTAIPSLKVRYNRVFGYYIEVTRAHLKNVPPHYQRKQTMVGAERFFTEELKKFEDEILTASVKQKSLEQELFQQLLGQIQSLTSSIMEAAGTFAHLDALASLAQLAQESGWTFPSIDESLDLHIQAGRHPMVDQAKRGSFVPNHLELSPQTRLTLLITGPNMGGKSTVMRQSALIIILGQMGAPVPAKDARWGVVSSLFTRIGAQDAISRGQSTFMVEMSELAQILHQADQRSFIVLDEIGRGTSTYDGISVAWATLEWICTKIQARTLFATHYHELIRLATTLPLLANAHMAVEGSKNTKSNPLRFLYELREGPTNDSFGIQVAQLAGLPKPVIERAWKVLAELESKSDPNSISSSQLSLFSKEHSADDLENSTHLIEETIDCPPQEVHPILKEIESVNVNEMTPIQALNLVSKLKDLCI